MQKIKIYAVVVLASYGASYAFLNIIPIWLGILLVLASLVSLILMNIGALKVKGIIKKLTILADIALGLVALLFFVPRELSIYVASHYLANFFLFVFVGLIIAILVNAYKEK